MDNNGPFAHYIHLYNNNMELTCLDSIVQLILWPFARKMHYVIHIISLCDATYDWTLICTELYIQSASWREIIQIPVSPFCSDLFLLLLNRLLF